MPPEAHEPEPEARATDGGRDLDRGLEALAQEAEARGYAAGLERATAETRAAVDAVGDLATRLETLAPHETAVVARIVVDLALAVAARILDREVEDAPSLLVGVIERALRSVNGSPEARVYLHPGAVDAVRSAWESAFGPAYLGKRWIFEADPALPPGGCTLRHEHGFVEAGLDVQLEEIRGTLERTIPLLARRATEEGAA